LPDQVIGASAIAQKVLEGITPPESFRAVYFRGNEILGLVEYQLQSPAAVANEGRNGVGRALAIVKAPGAKKPEADKSTPTTPPRGSVHFTPGVFIRRGEQAKVDLPVPAALPNPDPGISPDAPEPESKNFLKEGMSLFNFKYRFEKRIKTWNGEPALVELGEGRGMELLPYDSVLHDALPAFMQHLFWDNPLNMLKEYPQGVVLAFYDGERPDGGHIKHVFVQPTSLI